MVPGGKWVIEMTDDSKGDSDKSKRFGLGYVDKRYCLKGVAANGWQELKLSVYKGGMYPSIHLGNILLD